MNRFTTTALLLAALSLAGGAAAAPACSFEVPAQWARDGTRWDGECADGRANGLGVLKEYRNGSVAKFFFGRLRGGQLVLGVSDQPEGVVAGSCRAGRAACFGRPGGGTARFPCMSGPAHARGTRRAHLYSGSSFDSLNCDMTE